ncbi:hypothetical protein Hanom_Chr16g01506521 [Helianthus anomalus]
MNNLKIVEMMPLMSCLDNVVCRKVFVIAIDIAEVEPSRTVFMFANKKMQKVSLQSSHGQPCTRCITRRCFNDSDVLLCMCIYNYIAFICNSYTLYRGVDYDFQIS